MKMEVRRFEYSDDYTIGKLYLDGSYECYTLEGPVRDPGVKVQGHTAIPCGTYKVVVDYSNHFGKDLPHILDVPIFEGIRIHPGNTDKDTEGCLLVGQNWAGGDFIGNSKAAFEVLFPKIKAADDCSITYIDTL